MKGYIGYKESDNIKLIQCAIQPDWKVMRTLLVMFWTKHIKWLIAKAAEKKVKVDHLSINAELSVFSRKEDPLIEGNFEEVTAQLHGKDIYYFDIEAQCWYKLGAKNTRNGKITKKHSFKAITEWAQENILPPKVKIV